MQGVVSLVARLLPVFQLQGVPRTISNELPLVRLACNVEHLRIQCRFDFALTVAKHDQVGRHVGRVAQFLEYGNTTWANQPCLDHNNIGYRVSRDFKRIDSIRRYGCLQSALREPA